MMSEQLQEVLCQVNKYSSLKRAAYAQQYLLMCVLQFFMSVIRPVDLILFIRTELLCQKRVAAFITCHSIITGYRWACLCNHLANTVWWSLFWIHVHEYQSR